MQNPYEVLGVPNNSDIKICEKAYRKLAMTHHPDRGGKHEKMSELNIAIDKIRKGYSTGNTEGWDQEFSYGNYNYNYGPGNSEEFDRIFKNWYRDFTNPYRDVKKEIDKEIDMLKRRMSNLQEEINSCNREINELLKKREGYK